MRHCSTRMVQINNNVKTALSFNLLTSHREQPRSTRIVVAYSRLALSATEKVSFDLQAQVPQDHTSCKVLVSMSMGVLSL